MALNQTARKRRTRDRRRLSRLLLRERELWEAGHRHVAGVDEAGTGPLAGPVVAAAVIFPPQQGLLGVDDSKRLPPARRTELACEIREHALAFAIWAVAPEEIDSLNIYHAASLAMCRAVEGLDPGPDFLLIDGRKRLAIDLPQESLVKGDARCHAIAAASILAKTERDAMMERYDSRYPGYGFAVHKGYATAEHRAAIRRLGPSPIHRRSFTLLPHPRLFE